MQVPFKVSPSSAGSGALPAGRLSVVRLYFGSLARTSVTSDLFLLHCLAMGPDCRTNPVMPYVAASLRLQRQVYSTAQGFTVSCGQANVLTFY